MRMVSVLGFLTVVLAGCGQVDPGERAVFVIWGKMDQQCYREGWYAYNPLSTNMDEIDIKDRKLEVKKLSAATADLQEVHADVAVIYGIDGDRCHILLSQVGHDYESRVIQPAVAEALKVGTAHFPIDRIIRERKKLKDEIIADLRSRLGGYGIKIQDIALTDFGLSQAFAAAVEQKQIAEQRVQQAEYERQQAVKQAEARVARADGEAKANKLLAESLKQSPETLRFKELEVMAQKWDGKLPQVVLNDKAVPLMPMR